MSTFKSCSGCNKCWNSVEEVLDDENMILCGYQPFPNAPDKSFLLFNHDIEGCGTTISFPILPFKEYFGIKDEFESFVMGGEPDCEGRCLNAYDLGLCGSKNCKGKAIRIFIQKVKERSLGGKSI